MGIQRLNFSKVESQQIPTAKSQHFLLFMVQNRALISNLMLKAELMEKGLNLEAKI